jgi:uncharacterized repeat protein (TIGR04052 family)
MRGEMNLKALAPRLATLLACLTLVACSDDEKAPEPRPFALSFAASADGKDVGCEDKVEGLGPDQAHTVGVSDLRFYVSNLKFWSSKGEEVALTLDENDFQYRSADGEVALVDLTSNTEGTCAGSAIAFAEGTRRTNAAITGATVVEQVEAVSFDLGVPQDLMRAVIAEHTPEGAPSPLAEMQWTWATGYRHFVMNFTVEDDAGEAGEGYLHVGSRDCGPADGLALEDRDHCDFVNTPQVKVSGVNLDSSVLEVDVRKLLSGLDFSSPIYDLETFEVLGSGPGVECHSSPMQPDCENVFENFGLDMSSGDADSEQNAVFVVD